MENTNNDVVTFEVYFRISAGHLDFGCECFSLSSLWYFLCGFVSHSHSSSFDEKLLILVNFSDFRTGHCIQEINCTYFLESVFTTDFNDFVESVSDSFDLKSIC